MKNQKYSSQAVAYHFKNMNEIFYLKYNITRSWIYVESYTISVFI